ncbi:MAG: GTPase RsgA [Clostridiaceae bacterium]|nr:GTPase RsgA [Clostridiaceae bacterium]
MQKGLIISNISNLYQVQIENSIIECIPRGKMKQDELSPVVGDYVEIEELKDENKGIISNILPRKMYSKRPKIANITQIILVISLKSPKPDLLLLDKQLAYSEYLKIKPVICINKVDLENKDILREIHDIYETIGYKVIDTIAKEGKGINEIAKVLEGNITAFSGNSGVRKININ